QTVKCCVDHFRRGAALTQFTRQLDSTMLASREQVHCGSPHRDECIEYGVHRIDQISASARSSAVSRIALAFTSGVAVSSLSRICFSRAAAISGLSCRNLAELALP